MAKKLSKKVVGGWTPEQVKALILKSDVHVERALLTLYAAQTEDEQAHECTSYQNGVGFNGTDAKFGSSLAKQILSPKNKSKKFGEKLSPKQVAAARKMLVKYRGQLCRVANIRFANAVACGLAGLVQFAQTYGASTDAKAA